MADADPMDVERELFKLSATLAGHEQDVRCVGALANNQVLTGSRDSSVRVWAPAPSTDGFSYACTSTLLGHSHYVGTLTATPLDGLASGSNDKHVIEWDLATNAPARVLEGHEDVVSCVRAGASGDLLYSASWDKTARVWRDGACVLTLKGHDKAVWSVLPLDDAEGRVLTASADRTIKLWDGQTGAVSKTYEGHQDVVRDLALVAGVGFLSGSNDGTVRLWELGGECLRVLQASESFVYAVALLPSGEWVTCSEDRTVRVWHATENECVQAITHPATVWATAVMPNGDLLAGCANGNAYVWSKTAERAAPDEQVVLFKESVAAVALPAEQAEGHGLDTSNMASEEALANPGEREGQHKIIKDSASGQPTLYTWSAGERTWNKVGEIVGSKDGGGGGSTLGKRTYEGKEYDYLFDIDLDGATAKLPFNKGDDPWMAAQQFIWRHGLDQAVLDTVANHIVKNTPGNVPAATAPMNADPFTSGGAYRPGAAPAGVPASGAGGYEDPISAKRYRPGNAGAPAPPPAAPAAVAPAYVGFETGKHDAALAKLLEFNGQLGGAAQPLAETDIATLTSLVGLLKGGGAPAIGAAHVALFTGGTGGGGTAKALVTFVMPSEDQESNLVTCMSGGTDETLLTKVNGGVAQHGVVGAFVTQTATSTTLDTSSGLKDGTATDPYDSSHIWARNGVTGGLGIRGTTENVECSNRGTCDYSTGTCQCYTGFSSKDCSTQNALAAGA